MHVLTSDASQPLQCIKRKQSSIPNNILKNFDSLEKRYDIKLSIDPL